MTIPRNLLERLWNACADAIDGDKGVKSALDAFTRAGFHPTAMHLDIKIDLDKFQPEVDPQLDADFLRSLRIAPMEQSE